MYKRPRKENKPDALIKALSPLWEREQIEAVVLEKESPKSSHAYRLLVEPLLVTFSLNNLLLLPVISR